MANYKHKPKKLTEEQVAAMRSKYQRRVKGHTAPDLAAEYGVTVTTVMNILEGRSWAHTASPEVLAALAKKEANKPSKTKKGNLIKTDVKVPEAATLPPGAGHIANAIKGVAEQTLKT